VAIVIKSRESDGAEADGRTALPFLAALVIIVLVVIGIGVMTLMRRGEDSEREAVVKAVLAQNDALQRLDYADFRANMCAAEAGTESDVIAIQQKSAADRGARYVDNVTAVTIDGDRATAMIVYHFAGSEDSKIDHATTFVREDGSWRVCSPGPR
jgi:hypothetical protein